VGWVYGDDVITEYGEWTPGECINKLTEMLTHDEIDEIVVEEWILYESDAKKQSWSKMLSSQLIGSIKTVAFFFRIPVVEQGAYIKKPTRAQMRGRKIRSVGGVIHTKDAELHWWHRKLRHG
jgi:hypothetical protein